MVKPSNRRQLEQKDASVKRKRSRLGCLTCRQRKKRCDESKPICETCKRLKLTCTYPTPGLEYRNKIRRLIEGEEFQLLPDGSHKRAQDPDLNSPPSQSSELIKKELADPASSPMASGSSIPSKPPGARSRPRKRARSATADPPGLGSSSPVISTSKLVDGDSVISTNNVDSELMPPPVNPILDTSLNSTITTISKSLAQEKTSLYPGPRLSSASDPGLGPGSVPISVPVAVNGIVDESLLPGDSVNPMVLNSTQLDPDDIFFPLHTSQTSKMGVADLTPPPLELEAPYLLNIDYQRNVGYHPSLLDDSSVAAVNSGIGYGELVDPFETIDVILPTAGSTNLATPSSGDESVSPSHPVREMNGNTNGSTANFCQDVGHSTSTHSQIIRISQKAVHPGVATPIGEAPSTALLRRSFPDLSGEAVALFEYFRDKQSLVISVSPLNYFRSIFLVISIRCRIVLYALLAWAGWHAGMEESGRKYFQLSSSMLRANDIADLSKEEILSTLILLASAKICSGDVSDWRNYMVWAGEVIQSNGGISCFMESESVLWLLKNFAYKEILTSASSHSPTLFSSMETEFIFAQSVSPQLPDTLLGCCEPLFVCLAITNEMARESRSMPLTDRTALESIFSRAHRLEDRIRQAKPEARKLANLNTTDKKLQIDLFDLFKLVALLHIYKVVLHTNSATLRVRYINLRLLEALPKILGTSVDGILTFPLFIAGICCADAGQRLRVMDMFEGFLARISMRNVKQAQHLVQEVWKRDNMGQNYVDWAEILAKQGLNIAFV